MKTLALPMIGKLPNIKYVQVMTHSRCNADCVFPCTGDTLVRTQGGNFPIGPLARFGEIELLAPCDINQPDKTRWYLATVRSYGIQPTYAVHLRSDKNTRNNCVVRTSADHRWPVVGLGGEFVSTMNLGQGRLIPSVNAGEQFTVTAVMPTGQSEEVFCATVPYAQMFALASGVMTGNCPYSESEHVEHPGTMTDAMWHHVLNNLRPFAAGLNTGKFAPYLMQEPLIDKTIFSKIADIYRCFPQTEVEVSTNGAALTDKVIDKLFEQMGGRRHHIWVSHHGINKETLEHIMKIDYEKSHNNLINLLKKSNGRFKIRIRGAGESRVPGIMTYFNRQQYLDYWAKNAKDHGLNMRNVDIDAFTFHDRANGLHRTERGACNLNTGFHRLIDKDHPFHCSRIDEWIHIGWDGQIILCCMSYGGNPIATPLPSLKDTWLVEYFHSKEYRDLVETVSGRKESPDDFICKQCLSPGG